MKSIQFVLLFLLTGSILNAQNAEVMSIEEVNDQIWKVFKQSYEQRDFVAYNNLHTDDVLRVTDGGLLIGEAYKNSHKNWQPMSEGQKITIDFAFDSRQYGEDVGYEVGYYKVVFTRKDAKGATYYGRFHVVLKKIDGSWKIAQDYDTSSINGMDIDAGFFDNAQLLDLGN